MIALLGSISATAQQTQSARKYFAHPVVEHPYGVIAIRFWNRFSGEAMVQAIEIAPADGAPAIRPVSAQRPRTQ